MVIPPSPSPGAVGHLASPAPKMQLPVLPWHPGKASESWQPPALFASHCPTRPPASRPWCSSWAVSACISASSGTGTSEMGTAEAAVSSCRRRTSQQGTQGHRIRSDKCACTAELQKGTGSGAEFNSSSTSGKTSQDFLTCLLSAHRQTKRHLIRTGLSS